MPNPEPTHTPLPPMQPAAHNPSPPPANPTAPVHSIKINLPKFDKQ
jgi:hypothetical protein